jgi:hypothetical protein
MCDDSHAALLLELALMPRQRATGRFGFVSKPRKAAIEGDASLARQINGVMTFANTAGSGWRANLSLLTTSRTDSGSNAIPVPDATHTTIA